jgi:hypothetical protein
VTSEGDFKRVEDRAALLAPGGADRANATEGVRASIGTERARDLLLDLDHAQITFRLIVVEGHGEVVEEAQRLVLVGPEPVEEVARWAQLAPTSLRLTERRRQRILGEPVAQQRLIAGDEVVADWGLEARGSRQAGVLNGRAHVA